MNTTIEIFKNKMNKIKIFKISAHNYVEIVNIIFIENNQYILLLLNNFNHKIDNLPNLVIKILIGNSFNHPLNNLPNSLLILIFSGYSRYNHNLDYLPSSIKTLTLGLLFTSKFIINLPNSIIDLINKPYTYQ